MARTRVFSRLQRIAKLSRLVGGEQQEQIAEVCRRLQHWERDRRGFLVGASQGLLAALAAGCDGPPVFTDQPTPGTVRVAIIGAGLAGLHCAYRLGQASVQATVYEASSRIGGRTFTDRESFDPQVAELGGEFIDTGHVTMQALAAEFNIQLDDREVELGPDTVAEVWWVEGQAVPNATIVEQFTQVAPLMADLVEQADTDDAAFVELDGISLGDWLTEHVSPRTYPELNAVLTAAYRGEYGLEVGEQSVLNLLYLIGSDDPDPFRIFGESDERFHARTGSQTFAERLLEAWDGELELGARLTRARRAEGAGYILSFERDGETFEAQADHVVFALPFSTLREVDLAGLQLPSTKQQMIEELGYGTNTKVMGKLTERVWRTEHDASGSVTSNTGLQQTWDSSPGQPGSGAVLTNFLGGEPGLRSNLVSAEEWFTDVTLAGIEPIFPGTTAAYVAGSAVRMHWASSPYSRGSYACYRPGQWEFWSYEGEAVENLHFCGEHTSLDFQGYMEGAVETGARAAGEILEILEIMPVRVHQGLLEVWRDLPTRTPSGRPAFCARKRQIGERIAAVLQSAAKVPIAGSSALNRSRTV